MANDNATDSKDVFESFDRNRIIFGAPGTGKSFRLNEDAREFYGQEKKTSDKLFEEWLIANMCSTGRLETDSAKSYVSALRSLSSDSKTDIFSIDDIARIENIYEETNCEDGKILSHIGNKHSKRKTRSALLQYRNFIADKSFVERVTFYPNYSYSQFIGCYKPVSSASDSYIDSELMEGLDILFDSSLSSEDKCKELSTLLKRKPTGFVELLVIAYGGKNLKTKGKTKGKAGEESTDKDTSYIGSGKNLKPYFDLLKKLMSERKGDIAYEFVPGPFVRVYERAKRNPDKKFLLIIEEINRANAPAVFGDIFQSLDRLNEEDNSNGRERKKGDSRYPVATSEDLKKYLRDHGVPNPGEIAIPHNMYIWATMNSADQGVQPLDTAFKRRWEFEYLDIDGHIVDDFIYNDKDEELNKISEAKIPFDDKLFTTWGEFRTKLNEHLLDTGSCNVHEDKCLGPFFIDSDIIKNASVSDKGKKRFKKTFKSKVLMYLFEDVVKMNPFDLFEEDAGKTYSKICNDYEKRGLGIFKFSGELTKQSPDAPDGVNAGNKDN